MKYIVSVVVKLVNTVFALTLNHRIFKQMCEAAEADYGYLFYHTEVRWPSRGNRLEAPQETFVSERGLKGYQQFSEFWLCQFGSVSSASLLISALSSNLA